MARHRCGISWKRAVLPAGAMTQRWDPQTRYTLRRNTASVIKELILIKTKKIQFHINENLICLKDKITVETGK